MSVALAVGCAAGSAACFGLASALQHAQAGLVQKRGPLDPALLGSLARRPAWLASWPLELTAIVLQALALRWGAVTLVQAVIVAGLPVAVVVAALLARRRLALAELIGVVACCGGILLVLAGLARVSARSASPDAPPSAVAVVVLVALGGALLVAAREWTRGAGAMTGAAAGVAAGAAAVPLAVAVRGLSGSGLGVLLGWSPWLALAAGTLGLLLSQAAFQHGSIGAPLAALTVVEPVVGAVLAAALLRAPLAHGVHGWAELVAGAVVAAGGVVLLAPSAAVETPV
ncbi:hypothetical protein EV189_2769 [Motilibacter rhizosphaerae]|uniref:Integral membrane protein n=1 Tax=Motilibacter rhizosphaerae TaxID=598652 RepID=A0A4Q7NQ62_9ACTN|nr:hypothetical protein [Motilibacter rhizosphaerae]RZS87343.1 hypothetical protein EV189_2769 [Motilibacter rhizosphaerae]